LCYEPIANQTLSSPTATKQISREDLVSSCSVSLDETNSEASTRTADITGSDPSTWPSGTHTSNARKNDQPRPAPIIICFPANPAVPEGVKKKRSDFGESRRKEVALVRRRGACVRCKTRKTTVCVAVETPGTSAALKRLHPSVIPAMFAVTVLVLLDLSDLAFACEPS
jgi:hypothetical protein